MNAVIKAVAPNQVIAFDLNSNLPVRMAIEAIVPRTNGR